MKNNLQKGSNLNTIHEKKSPYRSYFPIQKPLAFTPRYGELFPFQVEDVVPSDNLKMSSLFDLRTFTLKSPLMQDVKMYKSSYFVPISAILPLNWDKVVTTPNIGEVCPTDASCIITLENLYKAFANAAFYYNSLLGKTSLVSLEVTNAYRFAAIVYQFFNCQGLASALGFPIDTSLDFGISWDVLFEDLIPTDGSSLSYLVKSYNSQNSSVLFTLSSRNSFDFYYWLQDYSGEFGITFTSTSVQHIRSFLQEVNNKLLGVADVVDTSIGVDLSRLFAYQLLYNEFHTNDNVDFVYSANSWRSAMMGLSIEICSDADDSFTFSYNGEFVSYDACSSHILTSIFAADSLDSFTTPVGSSEITEYLCQIFGVRRSLVYKDYFTNSRVSPLAVGNTDVSVNSNKVSVIDVTKNIQLQRFLNTVNRSGRKISNYFQSLFGVNLKSSDSDPIFLFETSDVIYGDETENTGTAQQTDANSITTHLQTKSNKFQFEVNCDRYGIVMSCVSFEVERFYDHACDRQVLKDSIFDYFNPYMQYVGDQSIRMIELNTSFFDSSGEPFGYTTRNMEYKLGFPRAIGGFVSKLPSWLFVSKDLTYTSTDGINPESIRSLPSTFDLFYVSLVKDVFDDYFHFIVLCRNFIEANRPMVKNPQILG